MKHNFPFFNKILVIYLIILQIVVVYQYLNPREILIENKPSLKENNNLISMLVEQENGEYQELKDTNWPGSEYVLNESLSGCENNSVLTWDKANKSIKVNAMGSDRCYVYFDIKKHYHETCQDDSATCKLAKTTLTDENLIYHQTNYLNKIGLVNKELSTNDESYRYSGASENVQNYVCFGGECSSNPNNAGYKYLYRIIGLFKNKDNKYEMKIIKADAATKEDLGDETIPGSAYQGECKTSFSGSKADYQRQNWDNLATYYWNSTDSAHLNLNDNTNVNMWKESNLNKVNLNKFYFNNIKEPYKTMVVEHEWQVGPAWNGDDAKSVYDYELGGNKLTESSENCYTQDGSLASNQSARQCNQNDDLTYFANVGMMYMSDYLYGSLPQYWDTLTSSYNNVAVKASNWLYLGLFEWSITRDPTPCSPDSLRCLNARRIYSSGVAGGAGVFSYSTVRPTLYLSTDVKISCGSGTENDPYQLEM